MIKQSSIMAMNSKILLNKHLKRIEYKHEIKKHKIYFTTNHKD